ncbi:etoposide-induced protein 2.4-domain-containing protein [Fennellomyces sp. T-0311]|nr:etoposide-induced protein 2.4-domain-containing protein [Fennellomyces sp. T-0311]
MASIVEHVLYFLSGLQQAFQWIKVASLISSSRVIQAAILKTIGLNGIIYLGALLLLDTLYTDHAIFGYSYTHLTGYPMYLICLLVNSKLFSQIALEAFQIHANEYFRPTLAASPASTVGMALFYINCSAFARLMYCIPFIGTPLSFFATCMFMAYYSFEYVASALTIPGTDICTLSRYKWAHLGWSLDQRLTHVEQHWAFFFGFGLPAALLTFFLSTLHAGGVFALIYPGYIVLATMAALRPANLVVPATPLNSIQEWRLPDRIPFFWPVAKGTYCVALMLKKAGVPDVLSAMSEKKDQLGKVV